MTDIEKKALALLNEVWADRGRRGDHRFSRDSFAINEALCRAIEQHEAFRQEVSDQVLWFWKYADGVPAPFQRFIIAKPDPLVEALNDMKDGRAGPTTESYAACLRAAIAKRGGKIVWEDEQ